MESYVVNDVIDKDIEDIEAKLKEIGIEVTDWLLLNAGQAKSTSRIFIIFSKKLTSEEKEKYMYIMINTVNYFNMLNLDPHNHQKAFNKYCKENIDGNLSNYHIVFQFERYPEVSFEFGNIVLEIGNMQNNDIKISNLIAIRTFLYKIYNDIINPLDINKMKGEKK